MIRTCDHIILIPSHTFTDFPTFSSGRLNTLLTVIQRMTWRLKITWIIMEYAKILIVVYNCGIEGLSTRPLDWSCLNKFIVNALTNNIDLLVLVISLFRRLHHLFGKIWIKHTFGHPLLILLLRSYWFRKTRCNSSRRLLLCWVFGTDSSVSLLRICIPVSPTFKRDCLNSRCDMLHIVIYELGVIFVKSRFIFLILDMLISS